MLARTSPRNARQLQDGLTPRNAPHLNAGFSALFPWLKADAGVEARKVSGASFLRLTAPVFDRPGLWIGWVPSLQLPIRQG
jgi:hypothetical protein